MLLFVFDSFFTLCVFCKDDFDTTLKRKFALPAKRPQTVCAVEYGELNFSLMGQPLHQEKDIFVAAAAT
ncbi:hypothetical protein CHS0354_004324 [Potamilus streckersoni]|uniref:Uncharacterized protein n=1 Tax=Potamilus streckersoni TaxID=2493646 RepID=A0AAE0SFZ3_9BIVA|nr:hypothetical protein CHS0354_004324 [Potamilus streckersoni]